MKMRDIIDIVDLDRIPARLLYELLRGFDKGSDVSSDEVMRLMYGDASEETEKKLQREKLRAEIRKIDADALKDVTDLGWDPLGFDR